MVAGISTACFYPEPTEDALKRLAKQRVAATEVFLNSFSELEPDYLRELRRIADGSGLRILSVHPFLSGLEPMLFFSRYPRRFEDGRDLYKRFYQAACILGGDIVVFHGNARQLPIPNENYFRRYGVLLRDAAGEGVRLCHENVARCVGRDPGFFASMRAALPQARFVLDIKQVLRAGESVDRYLTDMGEGIAHIHISDHGPAGDCLSIGRGDFNIPEFLVRLRKIGFDAGVVVELYRENFGSDVELFAGYQQLFHDLSTVS